jgi:hypothetical protein
MVIVRMMTMTVPTRDCRPKTLLLPIVLCSEQLGIVGYSVVHWSKTQGNAIEVIGSW